MMMAMANMFQLFLVLLAGLASAVVMPLASAEALDDCTRLKLPLERVVPRPAAYDEFCHSHPGQCDMTGPTVIQLKVPALRAIDKINREVNAEFRLIDDLEWRGKEEEWGYPVLGSGDCEDFALEKRKRLVESGMPRAATSIAIVHHKKLMCSHAVLLVETGKGTIVLDSLDNEIRCWDSAPYNYESRERLDGLWDRYDQSVWKWLPRN